MNMMSWASVCACSGVTAPPVYWRVNLSMAHGSILIMRRKSEWDIDRLCDGFIALAL